MNYKILIIDEAKIDFRKSIKYYKEINPKLATRFINSFKNCLSLIKKNPFHFQVRYDNDRVIIFETFPYLIHFEIYENLIVIKAIYHSSRESKLNIY